jgi:hypothetical protein
MALHKTAWPFGCHDNDACFTGRVCVHELCRWREATNVGALIDQYVHMMDLRLIAEAPGTKQHVRYPTLTEQRAAIARLAAVNADLLAALKDIIQAWDRGALTNLMFDPIAAARAAIRRAEGKDAP